MTVSVRSFLIIAGFCFILFFQNCSQPGGISLVEPVQNLSSAAAVVEPVTDLKPFQVEQQNNYVCEPFGGNAGGGAKSGLKAELRYINTSVVLTDSERRSFNLPQYFNPPVTNSITVSSQPLFFSQVNTPTRKFEDGFQNGEGESLMDGSGNKLFEFFALKYETLLKLSNSDVEGYYEIATISDDGSILEAKAGNLWSTVINNDGLHPAKMGCMNSSIYLDKNSKIPLRLSYFQGPRNAIANVLLWRRVGTSAAHTMDQECGQVGGSYFFDYANGSAPLSPYIGLLNRGWSPISVNNFELPNDEVNPCASGQPVIQVSGALVAYEQNKPLLKIRTDKAVSFSMKMYKIVAGVKTLVLERSSAAESADTTIDLQFLDDKFQYQVDLSLKSTAEKVLVQKSFLLKAQ
ncbi:MAG: hypothetical protein ACOYOK_03485 [Pseudobdellovibrionaceae bacterium]